MKMNAPATVGFNEPTPEGAAYRARQAHVHADIEGLARDPGAEKLMDDLRSAGVPISERMARLGEYLREKERAQSHAAE